jgi:hypothetical protein
MAQQSTYSRCCEILEIPSGSSISEIEQSFREMIKVWHPDRFSDNPILQERATHKTSEITRAYRWLRRHDNPVLHRERVPSTPERLLSSLRRSLANYQERFPATSDEIIERAVRALLADVAVQKKTSPTRTRRIVDKLMNWSSAETWAERWAQIVHRRRQILAWSVFVVLFLVFGAR